MPVIIDVGLQAKDNQATLWSDCYSISIHICILYIYVYMCVYMCMYYTGLSSSLNSVDSQGRLIHYKLKLRNSENWDQCMDSDW